jgi:hypothetical protein
LPWIAKEALLEAEDTGTEEAALLPWPNQVWSKPRLQSMESALLPSTALRSEMLYLSNSSRSFWLSWIAHLLILPFEPSSLPAMGLCSLVRLYPSSSHPLPYCDTSQALLPLMEGYLGTDHASFDLGVAGKRHASFERGSSTKGPSSI